MRGWGVTKSEKIDRPRLWMAPNYFLLLFTVRSDTLSDMVSHMTDSVGLVHQMPFSCDRSGLSATLEKVSFLRRAKRKLAF